MSIDDERKKLIDQVVASNDPSEIQRLCRDFAIRHGFYVSDGNGGVTVADEATPRPQRVSPDDRSIRRDEWDPSQLETTETFLKISKEKKS